MAEREPIEPSLEAAMRRGDDVADVYGDWLQERGHPRGRLIAVQRALREQANTAELRAEEVRLIDELRPPLAGIHLDWRDGFIERARVETRRGLDDLLRDPSARLLRELVVEYDETAIELVMRAWPPPPLRRLVLGPDAGGLPITVAGVGARYPDLEELELHGASVELDELHLPKLRALLVDAGDLSARTIAAIVGASWPALRTLSVHATTCTPFIRALVRAPLARIIDELALGRVDDRDADLLVLHRASFVQLVRSHFVGDVSAAARGSLREAFGP